MRVWEVQFEIHQPLPSLPQPTVIVEEIQNSPGYGFEGFKRHDVGGQLVITIAGRGRLRIGKNYYDLLPGMAFLHNHQDPQVGYHYPPDGSETWRFLWIAFAGKVENIINDLNQYYGYIYHLSFNGKIIKRLSAYHHLRGLLQVRAPFAGARMVMEILADLSDNVERELVQTPQSILITKFQQYIIENIASDLSVGQVAAKFQVSREHLTRMFKKQTGTTPHAYITRRRLQLACDLLQQTNLSCKEIADRVGYKDLTVFYRAFKTVLKITPNALRASGIQSI